MSLNFKITFEKEKLLVVTFAQTSDYFGDTAFVTLYSCEMYPYSIFVAVYNNPSIKNCIKKIKSY